MERFNLNKPVDSIIASARENLTKHAIFKYPEDLGPHAIVMNFKEYSYNGTAQGNTVDINASIVLPIPKNIQDTFSVGIASRELGILGAGFADALSGMKGSENPIQSAKDLAVAAVGGIESAFNKMSNITGSDFTSAARYLQRAGLTGISPSLGNAIDVSSGNAINPHIALVFEGVSLKNFTFDWSFSPKNPEEHRTLNNIIKKIKQNILPRYTSAGATGITSSSFSRGLLKYPNMVDLFFVGLDQQYFIYYKTCLINQFNIDYSPQDHLILFKGPQGSKPVFTNIQLTMTEAEIHTADDYEDRD